MRSRKRGFGKAIGVALLVLAVIFILRHGQIQKWYLVKTSPSVVRLNSKQDGLSVPLSLSDPSQIPEYDSVLSIELNGNVPSFTEYDLTHITGEVYSDLDSLGRCGSAVAILDITIPYRSHSI